MQKEAAASTPLFDKRSLLRLLLPLVVEQTLAITVGMLDTMMVSASGEAAVSGVSLVDQINILLIQFFSALATGGAIVISQYIGRRDAKSACDTAKQLFWAVLGISGLITVLVVIFNRPILVAIYGSVESDVLSACSTYFYLTALSFPFLAIYNVGASIFRSMGNTKVSMYSSLVMNLLNFGGNALFIYGMRLSVFGAGLSTLISRAAAALCVFVLLLNPARPVNLCGLSKAGIQKSLLGSIMRMGIPSGVENSMFQIGKLLVSRLVSSFGTASIAANAVGGNLATFVVLPGSAIGLGLLTVIGQAVGAKDFDGARRYGKKLLLLSFAGVWVTGTVMYFLLNPLISLYHLSAPAVELAHQILVFYIICAGICWPTSFTLPNVLKGAGDTRYTMMVSMVSMWLCRIVFAYVLADFLGMQLMGVWIAMVLDWVVRSVLFLLRFRGDKWLKIKVIS